MNTATNNVRNTATLVSAERAAKVDSLLRQIDRISYQILDAVDDGEPADYVDGLCSTRDALEDQLEAVRLPRVF